MSSTLKTRDTQRKPAMACGALILAAIALAAFGRQQHQAAPMIDAAAATRSVNLYFNDRPDGSVVALDAATGAEIERIAPGQGGFIRVTMRSFAGERKQRGLGSDEPFLLARMPDGDLVLQDRVTGRRMLLNAFGPSNEGVFAELLDAKRTSQ